MLLLLSWSIILPKCLRRRVVYDACKCRSIDSSSLSLNKSSALFLFCLASCYDISIQPFPHSTHAYMHAHIDTQLCNDDTCKHHTKLWLNKLSIKIDRSYQICAQRYMLSTNFISLNSYGGRRGSVSFLVEASDWLLLLCCRVSSCPLASVMFVVVDR